MANYAPFIVEDCWSSDEWVDTSDPEPAHWHKDILGVECCGNHITHNCWEGNHSSCRNIHRQCRCICHEWKEALQLDNR